MKLRIAPSFHYANFFAPGGLMPSINSEAPSSSLTFAAIAKPNPAKLHSLGSRLWV